MGLEVELLIKLPIVELLNFSTCSRMEGVTFPILLIIIKHQSLLTTFSSHSNYVTTIILLLFSNEIANIRCAAYHMTFFIIELISKVSIVISNTLESTSYHSP